MCTGSPGGAIVGRSGTNIGVCFRELKRLRDDDQGDDDGKNDVLATKTMKKMENNDAKTVPNDWKVL